MVWNVLAPVIGAVAGGLSSRGGGEQQQSNESRLNDYSLPFYSDWLDRMWGWSQQPFQPYSGQRVAGMSPGQEVGWGMINDWAQNRTPELDAASQMYRGTLSGDDPRTNPTAAQAQTQTAATQMANFTPIPGAQNAAQQWADNPYIAVNSPNLTNPWIGRTSQGIAGVGNAMDAVGQLGPAAQAQAFTGTASSAGPASLASASSNPYFGFDNPYTERAIADATRDMTRNFGQNVMPQLDRLAKQSGSFGNTGVQTMQQNAMSDFSRDYGDVANRMRMQDLAAQQQMGESAAGRGTNVSLSNAGAINNMGQFNAGLGQQMGLANLGAMNAASLANAASQNAYGLGRAGLLGNLATSDLARALGTQQFNANLGADDLARNAALYQQAGMFNVGNQVGDVRQMQNLAQQQSQFNAGQGNALNQFNVGQANQMGLAGAQAANQMTQFNAGQGNAMNQFNTGQANDMSQWNAGAQNQMATNNANRLTGLLPLGMAFDQNQLQRGQAVSQIGELQRQIEQQQLDIPYQNYMMANYQWPMQMFDLQRQGITTGNPGASGTSTVNYPGNWMTGAIGGAQIGSSMYDWFNRPSQQPNAGYQGGGYSQLGGWNNPYAGYWGQG